MKMHPNEVEQADTQLHYSIYGNWRKGVAVMGGGTCLAGLVSNSRNTRNRAQFCLSYHLQFTFFLYSLSTCDYSITIQKFTPTLDFNNGDHPPTLGVIMIINHFCFCLIADSNWKPFMETLLTLLDLMTSSAHQSEE